MPKLSVTEIRSFATPDQRGLALEETRRDLHALLNLALESKLPEAAVPALIEMYERRLGRIVGNDADARQRDDNRKIMAIRKHRGETLEAWQDFMDMTSAQIDELYQKTLKP